MTNLQTVLASCGRVSLSVGGLLRLLHNRRQLRPLLLEALAEEMIIAAARDAGLSVTDVELQQAADQYRQRHGLNSAEQTRAWLAGSGLSVDDFEDAIKRDLQVARFKRNWTEPRIADHFAAHHERHARTRLRQIIVASEGAGHELRSQVETEGADFAELARQNSLDGPSRQTGGSLGFVSRRMLPAAVAEAVFNVQPGKLVGPIATQQGFALFLVEELLPAELDGPTTEAIRQELFEGWLRDRLRDVRIDLSWLKGSS